MRQPIHADERAPRRSYWMPAVVLALGLGSLVLPAGTYRIHERLIQRDTARVRAIEAIQLSLATAHLWLEEYVAGDRVDVDEIVADLDRARDLIEALLGQPPRRPAPVEVRALDEDSLTTRAEGLRLRIDAFRRLSEQRRLGFEGGEAVGVGTRLDHQYDRVFREALADSRALQDSLERRRQASRGRAQSMLAIMLVAWATIVGLAAAGLWTLERRRSRAELALREREAELRQSQKMEAVGRLAGGIAHDINNHLAAIRAHCELVKSRCADGDRTAKSMDSIARVVGKGSDLIDRLLAFSRRQPVEPEVVNLNAVIEDELLAMLNRLLGDDVSLELRLERGLWNVEIDPAQIEQVVMNLALNARQAMPGGGTLRIETANVELGAGKGPRGEKGASVKLAVTDTGCGIAPEIRDKVFEPFFTTRRSSGGSGLGLATVYGIVEQGGGTIAVDSRVGHGTTFTVHLPRTTKRH